MKSCNVYRVGVTALMLCACSDPDEGESPEVVQTVAELADCDESDLQTIPFQGPYFDDAGMLTEPFPTSYIVATTSGWAKQDPEIIMEIQAHNMDVMQDVFARDGMYGAGFAWSDECGSSRTLSFWRDEEALMEFVFGSPHVEAIGIMNRSTHGWETTHWTEAMGAELPTFDDARSRLDDLRD